MEETNNSINGPTNPEITDIYNSINNVFMNPTILIILVIVVILYLVIFMSLGSSSNNDYSSDSSDGNQDSSSSFLIIMVVGLFIILAIINGMQYFFDINIIASITNLFSTTPEIDINERYLPW